MSELLRRGVYARDPKWLLDNLLAKYKVISVPTDAGWSYALVGSGARSLSAFYMHLATGTTASSSARVYIDPYYLNTDSVTSYSLDWSKRLDLWFIANRIFSDPECVGRIQLKNTSAEGALAGLGVGVEFDNYSVVGEAYGTARGTLSLGTIPNDRLWQFRIVHVPGVKVEFWVNRVKIGELTGNYVPSGTATTPWLVASIKNGPTGGVDAILRLGNIWIIQEW